MNIISVLPIDIHGNLWIFKKVVEYYGYPMYSKRISNAICKYQHTLSDSIKQNLIDYINRNFHKNITYKDLPIFDKRCDKLKRTSSS